MNKKNDRKRSMKDRNNKKTTEKRWKGREYNPEREREKKGKQ